MPNKGPFMLTQGPFMPTQGLFMPTPNWFKAYFGLLKALKDLYIIPTDAIN